MFDPVGVAFFPVTPFDSASELDEDALRRHVSSTIDRADFSCVIPLGSVGEFPYLRTEERERVVDVVVDEVDNEIPVLPGTSAVSTRDAVALSQQAETAGADGLLITPQSYFTPTEEGVYRHYAAISRAVDVPICAYNNPYTTNVDMSVDLIDRVASLDGVRYVKSGTGDLRSFRGLRRRVGAQVPVFAAPPHMFEKLLLGAPGWSGPIATIDPETALELYRTIQRGELARARDHFSEWVPLLAYFHRHPFTAVMKAILDLQGRPAGEPRGPIQPLDDGLARDIAAELDALGLI